MFYKDRKVLVTGGTGFVGTNFLRPLLEQGAIVRVPVHNRPLLIEHEAIEQVPADLTRLDDARRVCEGIDYVIHVAGAAGAAGVSAIHLMSGMATGLTVTIRVMEAAWLQGVKRVLILSSSTIYPQMNRAVKEEDAWTGPPHPSYFGYGWAKRYLELLSEFVASQSVTKVAIGRPTAVYGRYDNFDVKTGHVIPALIRRAMARENPFVVWGTGEEIRDFLHISDLVKGSLLLLEKYPNCDPVNIGYGKPTTIKEVVQAVLKATGHENAKIEFDASKPTTIPMRMVDISKARRILGFEPEMSIENGIIDTVQWYRKTCI